MYDFQYTLILPKKAKDLVTKHVLSYKDTSSNSFIFVDVIPPFVSDFQSFRKSYRHCKNEKVVCVILVIWVFYVDAMRSIPNASAYQIFRDLLLFFYHHVPCDIELLNVHNKIHTSTIHCPVYINRMSVNKE